jgi:hypothetical protein
MLLRLILRRLRVAGSPNVMQFFDTIPKIARDRINYSSTSVSNLELLTMIQNYLTIRLSKGEYMATKYLLDVMDKLENGHK